MKALRRGSIGLGLAMVLLGAGGSAAPPLIEAARAMRSKPFRALFSTMWPVSIIITPYTFVYEVTVDESKNIVG